MTDTLNTRSLIGLGTLLGVGFVLVAFNTARALQSDATAFARIVGIAVPTALALALCLGAVAIVYYELHDRALQIAGWTVFGLCIVTAGVGLNVVGIRYARFEFTLATSVVFNAAAGGAVLGLLIGLYNAQHRKLRTELESESQRAVTLSQRLSVINRVLRHDTRTQAQIIDGQAELLANGERTQAEALSEIRKANDRLTELAEQARKLQRMLSGEEFRPEPVDLVATVREVSERTRQKYPSLTVDHDLPTEQTVLVSPLIEEAIEHLLSNVAEHVDSPRPHAEVTVTSTGNSSIRLSIADDGQGIPETEPIVSGDPEESPLQHSNGFGLWFVTWVVEDVDGEIAIETPDTEGVGTVVTLELPTPPATVDRSKRRSDPDGTT